MLLASALLLLIDGAAAEAAEPGKTCPATAEVRALLVDERVQTADFRIEDLGTRFVLRAGAESRVLDEPAHDCAARAKMAAVVLTAMLAPPFAEERPMESPPEKAPTPPPAPPPRETWTWMLGLGPSFEFAPGAGGRNAFASAGLAARGGSMTKRSGEGAALGATAGVALYAPATFGIGPTSARIVRATLDASGHLQGDLGPVTLRGALGPALDLHDVRGTAPDGQGDFRTLFGLRGAIEMLVPLSRTFAAALELSLLLVPGPGDLALHASGVVGKEPAAYLGTGLRLWLLP